MNTRRALCLATLALPGVALWGCAATESSQAVTTPQVASAKSVYNGPRAHLVVGKFDNRSGFGKGIFSEGNDRLSGQAKTILITHLQQSNRFQVMDRDNMDETKAESQLSGKTQKLKGADVVVTGDVTEFGRKEVGDRQLFGVLGRGKSQVAYAKVSLNVVDAQTSAVVYSVQGAGEYVLSTREVVGFGSTASYDATLNGKVIDLAMREAVNRLVEGLDQGAWKPASAP